MTDITSTTSPKTRHIAMLAFPGCQILDVCGPLEVFSFVNCWLHLTYNPDWTAYRFSVIAERAGPIRTMSGLQIIADPRYSSGGVTAGMDLALRMIAEDFGPEATAMAGRWMLVFPSRPGGQSQFNVALHNSSGARRDFRELQTSSGDAATVRLAPFRRCFPWQYIMLKPINRPEQPCDCYCYPAASTA